MLTIENLSEEMKARVVTHAIDITGRTMMTNRKRLASMVRQHHGQFDDVLALKAVDFAIEILALLATDAEDNIG
jgi:hypothetical protein